MRARKLLYGFFLVLLAAQSAVATDDWPDYVYTFDSSIELRTFPDGPAQTIWTPAPGEPAPFEGQVIGEHLYWVTWCQPDYTGGGAGLWRADRNGQNAQLLVEAAGYGRHIESYGDKVYWSNEHLGEIYRADLDGQNVETVVSGYFGYSDGCYDIAIHEDRLYWTSWVSPSVKSVALDGSDFRNTAITGADVASAFQIEAHEGELYISAIKNGTSGSYGIHAINADGVVQRTLTTGRSYYTLEAYGDRMYYSPDSGPDYLYSVPLAGGDEVLHADESVYSRFTVVPEPTTMSLLALGGLAVLRRRKS